MNSRLSFIRQRMAVNLRGVGSVANTVVVKWTESTGGETDYGTGGTIGATETHLSGAMRALCYEVPARNTVIQHAEVQVGDLILDLDADPQVSIYPGQSVSGQVRLVELADKGLRYIHGGRYYEEKEISGDLQAAWDAIVGDVALHRTLLLKRQT